jgi:hypothetical protein
MVSVLVSRLALCCGCNYVITIDGTRAIEMIPFYVEKNCATKAWRFTRCYSMQCLVGAEN